MMAEAGASGSRLPHAPKRVATTGPTLPLTDRHGPKLTIGHKSLWPEP